ncbi:MAG: pyridoxamine 5'-phosphate oxidase family protein, partial [Dehalococcoidia bacterium]|nr:pyridoxamine 5'-phosphate oxidase family protein [Dehalococcoidia bacterium]
MLSDNIRAFLAQHHRGVLTTFRRNGAAQMSIITCGPIKGDRAKLRNLKRDSRCSLLISRENWRSFVVLEGRAEILTSGNTDAEELRLALRDAYTAAAGQEHPNWEEYDQTVRD